MAVKKKNPPSTEDPETEDLKIPLPKIHPRIVGEDSHDIIVGTDGKVTYVARNPTPEPPTEAQVIENAGANDPRKFMRTRG